jgi:hypothetical protein
VVIDAVHVHRHKDLREHIVEHRLDAILDPKTQAAATVGGYTEAIGELPWGLDRPHRVNDFAGHAGKELIAKLGDFAIGHDFTQVLAPTHLLQDATDPWLARDVEATEWLRAHLDRNGATTTPLIYSVTVPYRVFRNGAQRRLLVGALRGVPASAIWLKVDGFGSSSSPTAACAYIDAAADFHELGLPVIGDHVGGLLGLGLLAFGAVGGIAHGVTMQERFDASHWKTERRPGSAWSMGRRVYVRELDLMLKPDEARLFFESATRARILFGCRDRHCCPRGVQDMLENPARHFRYRRMEDTASLVGRRNLSAPKPSWNSISVRQRIAHWRLQTSTGRMTGWQRRPAIAASGWMPCGLRWAITEKPMRRARSPRCQSDARFATAADEPAESKRLGKDRVRP